MRAVVNGPLSRGGARNRALNYAVAASLVLHGALIFVSVERQSGRASAPPPIVARLAPAPVPAPPSPPAPRTEPPAPKPEPPRQILPKVAASKPRPEPAPKPLPRVERSVPVPQAEPGPAPVQDAPAAPPPSAPAAPPVVASPAPQPAAPAIRSAPARQASEGIDADALRRYLIDLADHAKKFKRYPRAAQDNQWEGKVVVRVVVQANGVNAAYTVLQSSGHAVLDRQAVDMVRQGRQRAPIPPELRGREFSLELPVTFELKDQGSG
jgi:protein TonB